MVATGNKDLDTCAVSQLLRKTTHYTSSVFCCKNEVFFIYYSCDFADDFEYDFLTYKLNKISTGP